MIQNKIIWDSNFELALLPDSESTSILDREASLPNMFPSVSLVTTTEVAPAGISITSKVTPQKNATFFVLKSFNG